MVINNSHILYAKFIGIGTVLYEHHTGRKIATESELVDFRTWQTLKKSVTDVFCPVAWWSFIQPWTCTKKRIICDFYHIHCDQSQKKSYCSLNYIVVVVIISIDFEVHHRTLLLANSPELSTQFIDGL